MSKTEKDLQLYLYDNIEIFETAIFEKHREFQTPVGLIDIAILGPADTYHIIEVKRGKASLSSCSQLIRYRDYLKEIGKFGSAWIASPTISANALNYLIKQGCKWKQIDHSI